MELSYKFRTKTETTKSKESARFRTKIKKIIEFIPSNPALGYQKDLDVVLSEYPDGLWDWENIVENKTSDTLSSYTLTTEDGVVSVVAHVVSETTESGDVVYSPDSFKFDLDVENYPYVGEGNSTLAFAVWLDSDTKMKKKELVEVEDGDEGLDVDFEDGEAGGKFTWVNTVKIKNGVDQLDTGIVMSSEEDGDKSKKYFFSLTQLTNTSSVFWDPSLGVDTTSSAGSLAARAFQFLGIAAASYALL